MSIARGRPGFTLIEVLIVIAIISILASILFPVFIVARNRSRAASCQSNLRQIFFAFEMYLDDWHGYYPNTGDPFLWMGRKWRWPLKDYLMLGYAPLEGNPWESTRTGRSVLLCPADTEAIEQWDSTSYAYSMSFYHTPEQINQITSIEQTWSGTRECVSQSRTNLEYPAQKALVSEWLSNHENPSVGWDSWEGGRNYLFADGHCMYLRARQIRKANDGFPDVNVTVDGIRGRDID